MKNEEVTLYNKMTLFDCYIKNKPCKRVEIKPSTISEAKDIIADKLHIKKKDIVGLVGVK